MLDIEVAAAAVDSGETLAGIPTLDVSKRYRRTVIAERHRNIYIETGNRVLLRFVHIFLSRSTHSFGPRKRQMKMPPARSSWRIYIYMIGWYIYIYSICVFRSVATWCNIKRVAAGSRDYISFCSTDIVPGRFDARMGLRKKKECTGVGIALSDGNAMSRYLEFIAKSMDRKKSAFVLKNRRWFPARRRYHQSLSVKRPRINRTRGSG